MLALEPETAAIYCKQITTQRNDTSLTSFQPGTKFLLLDLGGKTIKQLYRNLQYINVQTFCE